MRRHLLEEDTLPRRVFVGENLPFEVFAYQSLEDQERNKPVMAFHWSSKSHDAGGGPYATIIEAIHGYEYWLNKLTPIVDLGANVIHVDFIEKIRIK